MAYIIKCTDAFVNVKLTEIGREKLSQGLLNFSYFAVGDSEVNYDREEIVSTFPTDPTLSATSNILRPKDRQPNIKTYVHKAGTEVLNPLNNGDIRVLKVVSNNEAKERGAFSAGTSGYTTMITNEYVREHGFILSSLFDGTNVLNLTTSGTTGDWIMFKFSNDILGALTPTENIEPTPNLWYKIQGSGTTTVTLDRNLPNLSADSVDIEYFIYKSGEVYDAYGSATQSAYWDSGTLAFNSSCNISIDDVPLWNQNNVYSEDITGLSGTSVNVGPYEGYEYFGSYDYMGTMFPYLGYDLNATSADLTDICGGFSALDQGQKNIAILHYTNRTISNFYGEFFYINDMDDKTVTVHVPTIMYHRRAFSGSSTGDIMGMDFLASGSVKTIGTSAQTTDIEYVDLIEDPTLIGNREPMVVGRVFPQLKIIVIDNEEIVTAMSYKSNRNWTLPELAINLVQPPGGANTGILEPTKTMYVTYSLENESGVGYVTPLPMQRYAKITNEVSSTRNLEFRINEIDLFPYMRKIEHPLYDGRGFYADKFKLLYQIVDSIDDRPRPEAWLEVDYTSDMITIHSGETISPILLETQSPLTNDFVISTGNTSGATIFNIINTLGMAPLSNPELLQFGDERFFYGNIEAYIGATTFKTIFDIRLNSSVFVETGNPTRSQDPATNPPNIRVSEVGIYDEDKNLVVIGKIMTPIELEPGNTILIEVGMDF